MMRSARVQLDAESLDILDDALAYYLMAYPFEFDTDRGEIGPERKRRVRALSERITEIRRRVTSSPYEVQA